MPSLLQKKKKKQRWRSAAGLQGAAVEAATPRTVRVAPKSSSLDPYSASRHQAAITLTCSCEHLGFV